MFKYLIVSLVLLLPFITAQSQNQKVADSLKTELRKTTDSEIRLRLYRLILDNEGDPSTALEYADDYLVFAHEIQSELHVAAAWGTKSYFHQTIGDLEQSMEAALQAHNIYRRLKKERSLAFGYSQIASIQISQLLYDSAVLGYKKALTIHEKYGDSIRVARITINLGEAHRLAGRLDSATFYFKQSLSLNQSLQDSVVLGLATGNLGMVYREQGDYKTALFHLNQSVAVLKALGDYFSVAVYLFEIGGIEAGQGKLADGEEKLLQALAIANRENLKEQIRDFSQALSAHYEKHGDFERSLKFQRQYEIYKDRLVNVENVRKIEQLKYRHEADQKEAEMMLVTQVSEQRRITIYALGVGVLLFVGLAIMLFRNNQKIKVINGKLEVREKEKEVLLKELNHRTKNNLQMVTSLLHLQSAHLQSEEATLALEEGIARVESLTLLHQKLYKDDCMHVDTKDYLEELIHHLQQSYSPRTRVTTDLTVLSLDVKQAIPLALIVNELVTNAMKYGAIEADKSPNILVKTKTEGGEMVLMVSDEGEGLRNEKQGEEKSFGLQLVRSLTGQLKGRLNLDISSGTQWELTFNYG